MPIVDYSEWVQVSVHDAFDLSMSHARRFDWDPFVRQQRFLDDASRPEVGVRTWTKDRRGLVMVTRYLTFKRPHLVGMKIEKGPRIFRTFSGSWRFEEKDGGCEVHFRYNFSCRPKLLARPMEWIGTRYLGRDIKRRVGAFAAALRDGMRATDAEIAAMDDG